MGPRAAFSRAALWRTGMRRPEWSSSARCRASVVGLGMLSESRGGQPPADRTVGEAVRAGLLVACSLCAATPAGAATLQFDSKSADVLINTGHGFVRVESGTQVKPGDIVTTKRGVARVIYTTYCFNEVDPQHVYRVVSEDRCVVNKTDPANVQQGGVVDPGIVAGVVVAGGAAAAIVLATSGSSSP